MLIHPFVRYIDNLIKNLYHLTTALAKKYSHSTYLASPINDPEHQVVLIVFDSSLFFAFPHEFESLLQKAQRIKKLQHPHLLPILDIEVEQEQPFIMRNYLPNGSLRSHLKELSPQRLKLHDALKIVLQVGEALAYAHTHNIPHGNVKPENILFDAHGQALLTDFTLVSSADAMLRDQISEEYAFCYMAPEQFAGTYDARSDQYALGCLIYEQHEIEIHEMALSVPKSTAIFLTRPTQHGRRKFLALALLCLVILISLIAALGTYAAFFPFKANKPDMPSDPTQGRGTRDYPNDHKSCRYTTCCESLSQHNCATYSAAQHAFTAQLSSTT